MCLYVQNSYRKAFCKKIGHKLETSKKCSETQTLVSWWFAKIDIHAPSTTSNYQDTILKLVTKRRIQSESLSEDQRLKHII